MITVINGDLLSSQEDYICHQVNCMGVMGAGVALQIKKVYPDVYNQYQEYCYDNCTNTRNMLGTNLIVPIFNRYTGKRQYVVNVFAQFHYGLDGIKTRYDKFEECMKHLKETVPTNKTIAMPYLIGCGLAGGDWNIVYNIIEKTLGEDYEVYLYKYNK